MVRLFQYTEQEGLRDKLKYLLCRIIGHRIIADRDVGHRCSRCKDTMPCGFDRWQP